MSTGYVFKVGLLIRLTLKTMVKNENNKMKWKGGLVLLIFFTAFIVNLHVSNIHYFYTSPQTIKEDFTASLTLWLLLLVHVLIFNLGLNFTHKKILTRDFNSSSILKFNAVIWIILTILSEIYLFSVPCSGEECLIRLGFWTLPFFALGSVILFSVIPSLILYKIYDNKKAQKALIYIGILISAFFFILAFSKGISCNFNTSHLCLAEKAFEKDNPSFCEKLEGGFYRYLFGGSSKNNCYLALSDKYKGNENFCGNIIGDDFMYNHCVSNLARNTKNANLCNQIKSTVNDLGRDECLELVK